MPPVAPAAASGRRSVVPLRLAAAALLLAVAASVYWERQGLAAPRLATAAPSAFSEARVLAHVDALCASGPRATGSAAEGAAFEVRRALATCASFSEPSRAALTRPPERRSTRSDASTQQLLRRAQRGAA